VPAAGGKGLGEAGHLGHLPASAISFGSRTRLLFDGFANRSCGETDAETLSFRRADAYGWKADRLTHNLRWRPVPIVIALGQFRRRILVNGSALPANCLIN
jgi:hypothetical protein